MKSKKIDVQRGLICPRNDRHFGRFFSGVDDSEIFNSMTFAAQRLYISMILASNGKSECEFPHSRYKKFMSNDAFQKAKQQLIENGFIVETAYRCSKNRYRFSNEWQIKKPSTGGVPADGKRGKDY